MKIRKAVFPVAGLGTRFIPATKAMAKEMLPVVDKPIIQYAVEEAFEADHIFSTLMGDSVGPRRQFIEENAKYVRNLDI